MEKHPTPLVVTERTKVAAGIIALRLRAVNGEPLPQWQAGAHITVSFGDGTTYERQYSLCSDPADESSWQIAVRLDDAGRGGSAWLHEHAHLGVRLQADNPRNHFPLEPAPRYRFIAGGVGITPILSMVREADSRGTDWSLLYRGKDRKSMAFLADLASFGDRVAISTRVEQGDCDLGDHLSAVDPDVAVYACGPSSMLDQLALEAQIRGRSPVRMERFSSGKVATEFDQGFEVEFLVSGIRTRVPADTSLLEVAESHGISVFTSCREGTCGSCETAIIEGEAEHRDTVLSATEQAEQNCMMVCVSRAAKSCSLLRLEL